MSAEEEKDHRETAMFVRRGLQEMQGALQGIAVHIDNLTDGQRETNVKLDEHFKVIAGFQIWQAQVTERLQTGNDKFANLQNELKTVKEMYVEKKIVLAYLLGVGTVSVAGVGLLMKLFGGH